MVRAEDGAFPWLAVMQYVAAALLCLLFMICGLIWCIAAYRPDINPDILRMLNDSGWLIFVMAYPEYAVQLACIGIAGLQDKRAEPFLPRAACYATLVEAVLGGGGVFASFVTGGPLAWNGLVGFWLPIVSFCSWLIFVILPCLLRAIAREAAESKQASTPFLKKRSKKLLQV
jgi:predicted small integral membrane protein